MNLQARAVENLSKVTVELRGGDGGAEPGRLEWIVGLGVEGLTPFENSLLGKQAGEEVEIPIKDVDTACAFGPWPAGSLLLQALRAAYFSRG